MWSLISIVWYGVSHARIIVGESEAWTESTSHAIIHIHTPNAHHPHDFFHKNILHTPARSTILTVIAPVICTPSHGNRTVAVPTLHKNDPIVETNNIDPAAFHLDQIGTSWVSSGSVCDARKTGTTNNMTDTTNNVIIYDSVTFKVYSKSCVCIPNVIKPYHRPDITRYIERIPAKSGGESLCLSATLHHTQYPTLNDSKITPIYIEVSTILLHTTGIACLSAIICMAKVENHSSAAIIRISIVTRKKYLYERIWIREYRYRAFYISQ